jgi:AbrB family looped-hinge helix DNA binding protein
MTRKRHTLECKCSQCGAYHLSPILFDSVEDAFHWAKHQTRKQPKKCLFCKSFKRIKLIIKTHISFLHYCDKILDNRLVTIMAYKLVRPLRSGQITIPAEIRKELGIEDDTLLQLSITQGELRIKPVDISQRVEGSAWLQELYKQLAPVREELAEKYSEEEINSTIDQAVEAVRNKNESSLR